MAQPITISLGDLINHGRWGIGRVLNVEGTGRHTQAQVDFGDQIKWIVIARAPLTIIHKGGEGTWSY